jgi:nucleotide-binding universal stress UspA family protein
MLPIHVILHPTDFSKNSECAFQMATALARDYGAQLLVVHVAPVPAAVYGFGEGVMPPHTEVEQEVRQELDQIQAPDPSVRISHRLEQGDPVSEILKVADETHADLIVMGTHGRRGLQRLVMGSVAELIVRRASCPVLTVRSPLAEKELVGAAAEAGEEAGFAG